MSEAFKVKIGINPISWSNDDLPSLGGETPLEVALAEGKAIGYRGFELGNKFPRESKALAAVLAAHDLDLVSGWYSGRLARRSVTEEIAAVEPHLKLLADNGAKVMVYGEVADSIQGSLQPLYKRPRFVHDGQWREYADRLTAFAWHTLTHGVRLAYHHHMGAYVQSPSDVDRLMALTGDEVGLLFDSGHISFAGGDAVAMLARACPTRLPRALQGRAAAGDRDGAESQLELSRVGDQRRVHRPGRRRGRFRGLARAAAAKRLPGLAGRRGRAGSGRCAQLSLCRARLPPFARPGRTIRQARTGKEGDRMSLLVKGRRAGRDIVRVTPQSAGWAYVGFAAHRLAAAEAMTSRCPTPRCASSF